MVASQGRICRSPTRQWQTIVYQDTIGSSTADCVNVYLEIIKSGVASHSESDGYSEA